MRLFRVIKRRRDFLEFTSRHTGPRSQTLCCCRFPEVTAAVDKVSAVGLSVKSCRPMLESISCSRLHVRYSQRHCSWVYLMQCHHPQKEFEETRDERNYSGNTPRHPESRSLACMRHGTEHEEGTEAKRVTLAFVYFPK